MAAKKKTGTKEEKTFKAPKRVWLSFHPKRGVFGSEAYETERDAVRFLRPGFEVVGPYELLERARRR